MNKIVAIFNVIYDFLEKHEFDLWFGIGFIATFIQSLRTKMNIKEFVKLVFLSTFMGFGIFKSLENHTDWNNDVIVFITIIFSGFSHKILNQIEILIQSIAEFAKSFINNKLNK